MPRITIESALDRAQRVVRIAVIDNGPGVDPAVASRIFMPFVTTRARGTGLGLALVQKIIVTHNGRVTVQPEPGGGTRFTGVAAAVGVGRTVQVHGSGFGSGLTFARNPFTARIWPARATRT